MVVDAHVHHIPMPFNTRYLEWVRRHGRKDYGPTYLWDDPAFEDFNIQLRKMNKNQIDLSVVTYSANIVQLVDALEENGTTSREAVCDINDAMLGVARQYTGKLRATALIDLRQGPDALLEMERCGRDFSGFSVLAAYRVNGKLVFLDHPCFSGFWAKAEEVGLPVFIHFSNLYRIEDKENPLAGYMADNLLYAGMGQLMENSLCVARLVLSGLFDRHPRLKVVMGQLGGLYPFMQERFGMLYGMYHRGAEKAGLSVDDPSDAQHMLRNLKNYTDGIYVDTHSMELSSIRCAAEILGEDKVLYGSDYPITPDGFGMAHALTAIRGGGLEPALRDKILGKNAEKLLKLETT